MRRCSRPLKWKYRASRSSSWRCVSSRMWTGYPRRRCSSSEKVFALRLGTDGGRIEGGRMRPSRSRPGNRSSGREKKAAKPREKKLGELPGSLKISRGIWNSRWPMQMKMLSS